MLLFFRKNSILWRNQFRICFSCITRFSKIQKHSPWRRLFSLHDAINFHPHLSLYLSSAYLYNIFARFILFFLLYIYIYIYIYVCVCVWIYIYIYIYTGQRCKWWNKTVIYKFIYFISLNWVRSLLKKLKLHNLFLPENIILVINISQYLHYENKMVASMCGVSLGW